MDAHNEIEFAERCLCVFVLDTSDYMNENDAIGELNTWLKTSIENIKKDVCAIDGVEIAIITFNSRVDVIQEPDVLPNVKIPKFVAGGGSRLVKAILKAQKVIAERKQYYRSMALPYYRPWIIVLTNGHYMPQDPNINKIAAEIQNDVDAKKYIFSIIGVGKNIQFFTLNTLATRMFPAMKMQEFRFHDIFNYYSASYEMDPYTPDRPDVAYNPMDWPPLFDDIN